MLFIHACRDPTRLQSHSSILVPKTASASQYTHEDLSRDSSKPMITLGSRRDVEYVYRLDSILSFRYSGSPYHLSSYDLESTLSLSRPRTIEDNVYASGYDKLAASKRDDDPEYDAEDVEESESIDMFYSNSDDEHEACDFH